jgi:hypothetical protein
MCLPSCYLATTGGYTDRPTDWWDGFMKYAIEMDSVAMIYIAGFVKTGSGIRKSSEGMEIMLSLH